MQLSAITNINAPYAFVYNTLTNFTAWSHLAPNQKINVAHPAIKKPKLLLIKGRNAITDPYEISFNFMKRERHIWINVVESSLQDGKINFYWQGHVLYGSIFVKLQSKNNHQTTQLQSSLTLEPITLSAKMLFKSLSIVSGSVTEKFDENIQIFGQKIESYWKAKQSG